MPQDPVVEEIRRIRRKIEAECKRKSKSFAEHLAQIEARHSERLVRRAPKPVKAAETA